MCETKRKMPLALSGGGCGPRTLLMEMFSLQMRLIFPLRQVSHGYINQQITFGSSSFKIIRQTFL